MSVIFGFSGVKSPNSVKKLQTTFNLIFFANQCYLLGGFEQAANLRGRSQTLIQTWCYGSTVELSPPSFGSSWVALAPLGRLPWGSTTATRRPSPTAPSRACPEAMDRSWFLGVTRVRLLAPVISILIKFYQRKRT